MRRVALLFVLLISVVAAPAPAAHSDTVECNGVLTGRIEADVVVPENAHCTLFRAHVTGGVLARRNARLTAQESRIEGELAAHEGVVVVGDTLQDSDTFCLEGSSCIVTGGQMRDFTCAGGLPGRCIGEDQTLRNFSCDGVGGGCGVTGGSMRDFDCQGASAGGCTASNAAGRNFSCDDITEGGGCTSDDSSWRNFSCEDVGGGCGVTGGSMRNFDCQGPSAEGCTASNATGRNFSCDDITEGGGCTADDSSWRNFSCEGVTGGCEVTGGSIGRNFDCTASRGDCSAVMTQLGSFRCEDVGSCTLQDAVVEKSGSCVQVERCIVADSEVRFFVGGPLQRDAMMLIRDSSIIENAHIKGGGATLPPWREVGVVRTTFLEGGLTVEKVKANQFGIDQNRVMRDLRFLSNTGRSIITGNNVGRVLEVRGNEPPPFCAGNSAQEFRGQCTQ